MIITYGRPLPLEPADDFLYALESEVEVGMARFGRSTFLPPEGFDYIEDGFDFSIYSPPEMPQHEHATWAILRDVVIGVGTTVIGEHRAREVAFLIEIGVSHIFVGYGHFVAERKLDKPTNIPHPSMKVTARNSPHI